MDHGHGRRQYTDYYDAAVCVMVIVTDNTMTVRILLYWPWPLS